MKQMYNVVCVIICIITGLVALPCQVSATTPCNLTITTAGTGTGNTIGSTANGTYAAGTTISLVATADPGSTFAGWSPAVCVNGFALTADTACVATFNGATTSPETPTPVPMRLQVWGWNFGGSLADLVRQLGLGWQPNMPPLENLGIEINVGNPFTAKDLPINAQQP